MYIGLHVESRYSCQILMNCNFIDRSSKITQISSFMKILSVGAELFHADRRTDGQLIATFLHFANATKNSTICQQGMLLYFVRLSKQTPIISLYCINLLVSITEAGCAYCAVRIESLTLCN
jgi:hypothetical protein